MSVSVAVLQKTLPSLESVADCVWLANRLESPDRLGYHNSAPQVQATPIAKRGVEAPKLAVFEDDDNSYQLVDINEITLELPLTPDDEDYEWGFST